METNLPSCFYSIFRTTPEVSSKLYVVEICSVSEKLWLFNRKRADFWLPNFGFKRSLLSLLKVQCLKLFCYYGNKSTILLFNSMFRTTPEVSIKLYFVEMS